MEVNLETTLDIVQIVLLIAIIVQTKGFRDIWWNKNVSGMWLRTQFHDELIDQFGVVVDILDKKK